MRLRQSLLLLAAGVTVALIGLASDGSWPKVARVGAAAMTIAIDVGAALVLAAVHRGSLTLSERLRHRITA